MSLAITNTLASKFVKLDSVGRGSESVAHLAGRAVRARLGGAHPKRAGGAVVDRVDSTASKAEEGQPLTFWTN